MNHIYILFIISLLTISYIHTAQMPITKKPKQNIDPCFFAKLDPNIWDLIAQYLTFYDMESEEEFIKRTKATIKKDVPKKYYYKDFKIPPKNPFQNPAFPDPEFLQFFNNLRGSNNILTAFCSNGINVALLDENNLKIIHTKNDQLLHTLELEKKEYQHIALSRNAAMFTTIDEQREHDNRPRYGEVMRYIVTNYLTIKNIATQKTESFELPGSFRLPCNNSSVLLAFNKQGTHIILHGVDWTKTNHFNDMKKDPTPHHLIFPITVNEPIAPCKKTLQHYFQQKGICKSITSSINK